MKHWKIQSTAYPHNTINEASKFSWIDSDSKNWKQNGQYIMPIYDILTNWRIGCNVTDIWTSRNKSES